MKMDYCSCWNVLSVAISLSTIIVILYNRKIWWNYRSSTKLPPGSLGWPFLGETIQFLSCAYSDHPQSFMQERRRRYGNVFKSHLYGKSMIVSTNAEMNRNILQCDTNTLMPFIPQSIHELFGKSFLLSINGSVQRKLHGLIGSFLKTPHFKAQVTRDMHKYIQESMGSWKEDHLIYIQHEAQKISFQVLAKASIGLDTGEEMEYLRVQFAEYIAGFTSLPIKVPGSRLYKSLQAKKKMVKLVNKILESRRNSSISSTVAGDIADIFLQDASEQFTDEIISDNLIGLMVPGDGSVPILMAFAIKYLSDCPAALQEITEENMNLKRQKDDVGEPLYWNDYLSLPFTQCVLTETLRMGNIVVSLFREAMKDIKINEYLIPKGWCVVTDFKSVHLDENQYDSPHQFNPWRWQEKDVSTMSSHSFTPFGGGVRLCPAIDLSRLAASIFLHHFVTQFRWVAEDDSMVGFPSVSMKKGMPVRVKRRINR